jgi:glucan phosphoethanolaminetransferase (alkaline phosphatase superfamily)
MMESMSEHFLLLHDRENLNLLGSLEDVLPGCIRFTHFLPAVSSTIYSLECLLVKNVMEPISHSIYVNRTMETSSVKPFKEKGYQATFITGSKLGWRNMDKFIPRQYFDNVEGRANLEYHIKNTTSSDWGAYDEFLFERIEDILNEQKGTPQFIFAMTTSNHPPYTYPDTYQPLPVNVPKQLKYAHTSGSNFTQKHMITYQYANDCLGNFIKKIKNLPLGENTIIAIAGDHNARAVFDYSDMNPHDKYAVPFILYIPEKYKQTIFDYTTDCFASHKDVFPTIYHLALSDVSYIKSGVNLLDKQQTETNFGITDNNVILTPNGCIRFEMKPVYYVWADSTRKTLKPAGIEDIPTLNQELLYGKSYLASMTYLIQRCLLEK